jgi:hypothetical protein
MSNKGFFYRNSLSIVFTVLFLVTLAAQAFTGWKTHNQELADESGREISFSSYLHTGHFISSTFENFQSEFLQMALYVLLTVGLRQQGSAESKSLDKPEEVDREPKAGPHAPWAVRKGGLCLSLYSNSLSIVFFLLFFFSWGMHFYGSWMDNNAEQALKGKPFQTVLQYVT